MWWKTLSNIVVFVIAKTELVDDDLLVKRDDNNKRFDEWWSSWERFCRVEVGVKEEDSSGVCRWCVNVLVDDRIIDGKEYEDEVEEVEEEEEEEEEEKGEEEEEECWLINNSLARVCCTWNCVNTTNNNNKTLELFDEDILFEHKELLQEGFSICDARKWQFRHESLREWTFVK